MNKMVQIEEEYGDYKNSKEKCKICGVPILRSELESCRQEDGTYICPGCSHDIDSERLREKMGRD